MRISVSPTDFSAWHDLLALLQAAFAYMESRIDPPSSLNEMEIEDLRAKAKQETLIVAMEGTEIIGCAFAAIRGDCVYVGKVAVANSARRKGVARELIAAAEGVARQNQRRFLELQTRVELIENYQTFAALGFEKVAETAHPGYNRPTSITMRRRIAEIAA
jgi:N-acetylglutamate synthase-like GNAT family acetyltransferase